MSDFRKPVAAFRDVSGHWVVIADDGAVFMHDGWREKDLWEEQAPIPGTPRDSNQCKVGDEPR